MNFEIRPAVTGDFAAVYPLFEQLWPNKPLNRTALFEVFDRGVRSQTDELLCAVSDGIIIGFCAFAIVNNLWQEGAIAYVYAMVIDEKFRGNGFGSKLIQTVVSTAKEMGLKRVELDSGFQREQAHRFYQKLGFEKRAYLFSYPL